MLQNDNKPREAPLDRQYAITINVFPRKIVGRKLWLNYTEEDQRAELLTEIEGAINDCGLCMEDIQLRFELTFAHMLHAHIYMKCNLGQISRFQAIIHARYGLPSCDPQRVCFIEETRLNNTAFVNYLQKEDSDLDAENFYIPTYNMFTKS